MTERIWLGIVNNGAGTYADGEGIGLEKHKWDCGWYWGFGYVGNKNCHFHFDSFLENTKLASELFRETHISDSDWWVIRDLFKQAYALKEAAAVYRHGGHQTSRPGVTDIIKNRVVEDRLNEDLKYILSALWEFINEAVKPK
jgi:hypothetical protein